MRRPQFWLLVAGLVLFVGGLISASIPRPAKTVHPNLLSFKPIQLHFTPKYDCSRVNCIALTFDDGPDPLTTPIILDVLERQRAVATFFVVGVNIDPNAALLQRMQRAGHEIGDHSWDHKRFTRLKVAQMLDQINQTQAALTAAGLEPAKIFRPPYEAFNDLVVRTVPLPIILWNVDPHDWQQNNPEHVVAHLELTAKPGAIVVMHDTKPVTAAALEKIIISLKAKGYQLVTISNLLDLMPEARGVYFNR